MFLPPFQFVRLNKDFMKKPTSMTGTPFLMRWPVYSTLTCSLPIPSPPKVSRPPVAALAVAFSTSTSFWLAPSSLRTSRSCSDGFAPRQGRHRKTVIVPQRNRQLEVDYFGVWVYTISMNLFGGVHADHLVMVHSSYEVDTVHYHYMPIKPCRM